MRRRMCKSKVHRATVTDADLAYEGSITLHAGLMELAAFAPVLIFVDDANRIREVGACAGAGPRLRLDRS